MPVQLWSGCDIRHNFSSLLPCCRKELWVRVQEEMVEAERRDETEWFVSADTVWRARGEYLIGRGNFSHIQSQ